MFVNKLLLSVYICQVFHPAQHEDNGCSVSLSPCDKFYARDTHSTKRPQSQEKLQILLEEFGETIGVMLKTEEWPFS
jgi:hypothetical protein